MTSFLVNLEFFHGHFRHGLLEYLANGRPWQAFMKMDVLGCLHRAETLTNESDQLGRRGIAARPQLHGSMDGLAPFWIRYTENGTFIDIGVLTQYVFDIHGIHVKAAGDHHFLEPVLQV